MTKKKEAETIGTRIAAARAAKGMTQSEFAEKYTQRENENEFNGDEHLHLNRLIHSDAFNLMRRQGRQLLGLRMSVSSTVLGPKFSGHLGWFNVPDWR
jgi:hypothetical protein